MEFKDRSRNGPRFLVVAFDRLAAAHLSGLLLADAGEADIVSAHSPAELEMALAGAYDLVVFDTRNIDDPAALLETFRPLVDAGSRLVVLVADERPERLRWAVNARATLPFPHGILPATMTPEQVRAVVVRVAGGLEYWTWAQRGARETQSLEAHPAHGSRDPPAPIPHDLLDLLTPREAQILHLLKQGLRNKEVAERLAISVNTAKIHIASIKRKYRVGSRMQLL